MIDVLKKYWWVVIIVIVMPIVVNFILLIPAFLPIVGKNTHWLAFLGGYIGSLISTFGAWLILCCQLKQNHDENKKNRTANKKANEQNRKLQLNILLYQQEQAWLNQFRKAAAEYVSLYSYNDLVDVANIAREENPYKAFYLVKELFSRAGKADLNLAFIQRESDLFEKLNKDKTTLFVFYNQVLDDLQILLTIRISNPEVSLKDGRNTVNGLSDDMQNIIDQTIEECPQDNIKNQFNTAIMTRIRLIETCEEELRTRFNEYINLEQTRINSILQS